MSVQEVLDGSRRWFVATGHSLDWLRSLPAGVAQVCCTSPPYWQLRSYLKAGDPLKVYEYGQEPTPEEYVANQVEVFREVRRVLRDDGTLWLNVGDSYAAGGHGGHQKSDRFHGHSERTGDRMPKKAPRGLKPLDQCCIPHRLYTALIEDGWYGRADCVWAKLSSMPISVRGWRWERCRVKVADGNGYSGSKGLVRANVPLARNPDSSRNPDLQAKYEDCPGCKKCSPNGGFVLRKGSWRPTAAKEYVFLLAKSESYFMDGDAVRTPLSPVTVARDKYSRILDDPDEQCAVAHDHETVGDPAGANLRDVFRHDATAADVFAWLAGQDPALAELLWAKWRDGQGFHDVMRVGPEPLKAKHYAAYPTALVSPLLKASTSERGQCAECGSPWARAVERPRADRDGDVLPNERDGGLTAEHGIERTGMSHNAYGQWLKENQPRTTGWRATCLCNAPTVPQIVLDPYAGSGRTGMAARRLGLRFIGCELNPEFADMANAAIQADAIDMPLAVGGGPTLFDALDG